VHSPNPELRCELLSSRHRGPVGAGGRAPPRTFSERRRRGAGVGLLLTLRTRGSQITEEPQTDWPELVHKLPLSRALIYRLRAATSACSMTHLGSDLPLLGIASRPPTIREESGAPLVGHRGECSVMSIRTHFVLAPRGLFGQKEEWNFSSGSRPLGMLQPALINVSSTGSLLPVRML
jgi:hypothetical protein